MFSISLHAEDRYRGRGEAVIVNNNLPEAKKLALVDAFKNAVQRAVGVYVKGQTVVENFELSREKIIAEAKGYIRDYKIVNEEIEDGIYSVEIEADVYGDKIETAFSQRISKYIEENLLGPCRIVSMIVYKKNHDIIDKCNQTIINKLKPSVLEWAKKGNKPIRNTWADIQCSNASGLYLEIPINDPTIELDSIDVYLKNIGWLKPKIEKEGIIAKAIISLEYPENLNQYIEFSDKKNYRQWFDKNNSHQLIEAMIEMVKDNTILVRFKHPGTNKIIDKKIMISEVKGDRNYIMDMGGISAPTGIFLSITESEKQLKVNAEKRNMQYDEYLQYYCESNVSGQEIIEYLELDFNKISKEDRNKIVLLLQKVKD